MKIEYHATTSYKFYRKYVKYCKSQGITPLSHKDYVAAINFGNKAIRDAVTDGQVVQLPNSLGRLKGAARDRTLFAKEDSTKLSNDVAIDWGHYARTGERKHYLDKNSMRRYRVICTKRARTRYKLQVYTFQPVRGIVAELAAKCNKGETVLPI